MKGHVSKNNQVEEYVSKPDQRLFLLIAVDRFFNVLFHLIGLLIGGIDLITEIYWLFISFLFLIIKMQFHKIIKRIICGDTRKLTVAAFQNSNDSLLKGPQR